MSNVEHHEEHRTSAIGLSDVARIRERVRHEIAREDCRVGADCIHWYGRVDPRKSIQALQILLRSF